MPHEIQQIKSVITEEVNRIGHRVEDLILFGSRARGDPDERSDWHVLVVTEEAMDIQTRHRVILAIKRRLAALHIPNDVLVCSRAEVERHKNDVGRIHYYALREGVRL
jgi:Nucleotidyltransferase domain.